MNIENANLAFGALTKRKATRYIVLHHRAGNGDITSLHAGHLAQGWSGCGYHFYVRKDGSVWQGRPQDSVGAHCLGYNDRSIGVCFEGNFETEAPTNAQREAGKALVAYLLQSFPQCVVKGHRDLNPTACPGKNFFVAEFLPDNALMSYGEAIAFWQQKGVIQSPQTCMKAVKRQKTQSGCAAKPPSGQPCT